MVFRHPRILPLLVLPILLGAIGHAGELKYDVEQLSPAIGVLSLYQSSAEISDALSDNGLVFKLHSSEGVFKDATRPSSWIRGPIRGIDQLRGPAGIELVVRFNTPVSVDRHSGEDGVRYIFIATKVTTNPPETAASVLAEADKKKIAELRELVRKLSLEVVDVRKKLVRCEERKKE